MLLDPFAYPNHGPGVGSYSIEEGLSPNSRYFKNDNQRVDRLRGNLLISRTDIHLPGHAGLNLDIISTFNSDNYFYHFKNENGWKISSLIEMNGRYKIANGWRFRFPFLHPWAAGEYMANLRYITENGQAYQLTSAIISDINRQVFVYEEIEGYRIYNESFELLSNGDTAYTRVIEILPEKSVICCNVIKLNNPNIQFRVSNLHLYCPDGRVIHFNDLQGTGYERGKVNRIYDASKKNSITFTYRTDNDKIDYITDSIGRELHFEYLSDNSYDYINLYLKEGNKKHYLVQYKINKQNELEKIIYLKHDNGEPMSETTYEYTHTGTLSTKITYPYGGESIYHYAETYCARDYQWPRGSFSKQKPMVSKHYLKKSSTTPDSETQYTSFSYYNTEGDDHLIFTTIGVQLLLNTFPQFIPGTM